jgi:hypothetical protein
MVDARATPSGERPGCGNSEGGDMHWREVFEAQHHHVHRSGVADRTDFRIPDVVLAGLSDEQLRLTPHEGFNSIAWLFWHLARCEDVAINTVIGGRAQVLDEGGWLDRLAIDRRDIGTGMTPSEVRQLSQAIDVDALLAYRDAVGRRTRQVIERLDDAVLEGPMSDDEADALAAARTFGEHAGWVDRGWRTRNRAWFLWLATGHCYQHLGEAATVRALVGVTWPF